MFSRTFFKPIIIIVYSYKQMPRPRYRRRVRTTLQHTRKRVFYPFKLNVSIRILFFVTVSNLTVLSVRGWVFILFGPPARSHPSYTARTHGRSRTYSFVGIYNKPTRSYARTRRLCVHTHALSLTHSLTRTLYVFIIIHARIWYPWPERHSV